MSDETVDVVVIGAGLAGLRAAEILVEAGKRVAVVEARDRVGGRSRTEDWEGATIDLGGQWIGPGQHRLEALAARLGVETFPTRVAGDRVVDLDGALTREKTDGRFPSLAQVAESLGKRYVDGLAEKVPAHNPEAAPDALRLDGAALAQWRDRVLPVDSVRRLFDVSVKTVFGAEAHSLSVLYFLWYLQTGGGYGAHVDVKGGAQERRFVTGAQSLSTRLADALGDRVRLGHAVRSVREQEGRVRVTTDAGSFDAARVICATPPNLTARIEWSPALPAHRARSMARMPMGATVKFLARYARPFWRERGLSGEAVSGRGPISYCVDNSAHDDSTAMILGFVVGDDAVRWTASSPARREGEALAQLARWFGEEALRPVAVRSHDWAEDPWTGGCPVCNPAPGVLTAEGARLRDPHGRVHFAGTETATAWVGYFEGALESAERAAEEVLSAGA
ncbi:MAG: flavin monoamine oxidase family protein [Polyangiales bacterium]